MNYVKIPVSYFFFKNDQERMKNARCQLLKMARFYYIMILIKSQKGLELISSSSIEPKTC